MTRAEKIAIVDTKFLPVIETKKQAAQDAKTNYDNKVISLEDKILEYKNQNFRS